MLCNHSKTRRHGAGRIIRCTWLFVQVEQTGSRIQEHEVCEGSPNIDTYANPEIAHRVNSLSNRVRGDSSAIYGAPQCDRRRTHHSEDYLVSDERQLPGGYS